MCGIIGFTGSDNAVEKVMKGLSILEYRGYDSSGIAMFSGGSVFIEKCGGRIGVLEERVKSCGINESRCAIGHTRWATHGAPTDVNAHPHRAGKTVLVHNGIIENHREIKGILSGEYCFISETDTESAAALIDRYCSALEEDADDEAVLDALSSACAEMTGSYAFAVMFDDREGRIFAARRGSPLILAKSDAGYYLASDMTALISFTDRYYPLEEGECACLSADSAMIFDGGRSFAPEWKKSTMTAEEAVKDGYAHFMEKEMAEEPDAIVRAVSPRVKNGLPDFRDDGMDEAFFRSIAKVRIVGCGSAMHAGLLALHFFRDLAGVEAEVSTASEYRYYPPSDGKGTLVIPVSQSGETADTIAALRYAKSAGYGTLAVVNAVETTIAREADRRLYTYAGPEIAVATTKGYCTQIALLACLAAAVGLAKGHIRKKEAASWVKALLNDAPCAMREMLGRREVIRRVAGKTAQQEQVFFIGRGPDYAMAEEGALKLKEISYIRAQAYAAGELKHGTISLIEEGTFVAAVSVCSRTAEKTESNIREVKSRGAYVVVFCAGNVREDSADERIVLPGETEIGAMFASLAALQMLAYETAVLRGCDIDKPRNLAKSVTVE